jgi:hypothetical protein
MTTEFSVKSHCNSQASTIGSGPDESGALVLALLDGWTELKRMSFITWGHQKAKC